MPAASVLYDGEVCLCGTEQPMTGHHCPTLGRFVWSSFDEWVGGIAWSAMAGTDSATS